MMSMELIGTINILASKSAFLRDLAQEGLVQPETASKIYVAFSSSTDITAVDKFRRSLAAQLRGWVERDNEPSQRHFWNFYDSIREHVSASRQDADRICLVGHSFGHCVLSGSRKNFTSRPFRHGLVIDGQHRFSAFEKTNRDLSGRAIRSVLQIALDEIDNFEDAETIWDVLEVLDSSLTRGIAKRIRWADQRRSFGLQGSTAPSTREWVLGFLFRTGNPPPAPGRPRPADGWAIVTIITDARREDYATVQGQKVSRNLRNTICEQRARAHFNRGTQNHANHGGSWQPAGYRHPLSHHSLAQCA
jgi:hypothetical protein